MKHTENRAAPRLQFSEEELAAEGLQKPIADVQKAAQKADRAKRRLPKKMGLKRVEAVVQHTVHAGEKEAGKISSHESFAEQVSGSVSETSASSVFSEVTAPSELSDTPIADGLLTRSKAAKKQAFNKQSALKPGDPIKPKPRLTFDEVPRPKSYPVANATVKPTLTAVRAEIRSKINRDADGNAAVEASEAGEQAGASTLQFGEHVHHRHELRQYRKSDRAEHRLDQANIRFLQKKDEAERVANGTNASNPISRAWQKRQIKKDYIAGRYGTNAGASAAAHTGSAARKSGKEAGKAARDSTEKIVGFVSRHKGIFIVLAVVAMLIFIVQSISAVVPLLESGLSAITAGTYPAEEADVLAAERAYAAKERTLKDEMDHYERYHPGYDEYVVDAQEIWHDPYALIAIISAYRGGEEWTIDDAYPIIEKYFDWQYEVEETITSQRRYRTEIVDGEETQVWFTKTTCTVTLKNKILSHAPVYTMSRENMGLYSLYMSTHGNMDGLFHGPHCSTLKDPLEYDVSQELLDADPKFALLIEEANKRLGYPYVWGGYTPDTSFDCSGFVSWLFTSTGVRNIGHAGAKGLYSMCRKISPEEALPGDVIFFQGTIEGDEGITHCGLYVGNGMMVHCGSPCTYASIEYSYYRQHFFAFGRMYEH